jgi:alpha-D-xyloside xylohydrolase
LPLEEGEKLFGLGLQFMRVNHRGRTRFLRVNSDPKQDTGETHAPVPFYVSSRGYGLLIHTASIVTIYCGSSVRKDARRHPEAFDRNTQRGRWKATPASDEVEIVLSGPDVELVMFAGPRMLDVVSRYNLFCGGGTLPPRWGLGFWHRVPSLYTADQVREEARQFRERGFPCDVIGLEPGWHSKSYPCTYEWAKDRFPDPAAFVSGLLQDGFRVNLWENPYVSPDARIYSELEKLAGSHTVWAGLAPDYTLPEAQAVYKKQHEDDHASIGVAGYKLDECDGSELTNNSWMFPAHAEFPSGLDGEQMRQLYGLLLQRMTKDMYKERDIRTYGLVRASGAGASSLPYVLYSDLYDHRQFVRALINSSFSGLLWTPEVRKAKSAEEWVRRMQVVCFSPLAMLNAWADGTKPWSFPEAEPIIRKYIQLRMRLLPYLYSAFAKYRFEGIPPFRALQLEMDTSAAHASSSDSAHVNSTDAAYGKQTDIEPDDQFMAGDSLVVAPLFEGQTSRSVYLPAGCAWYDFETGERFDGGQTITVEPGLEKIPVYVKDGGIVPMMPVMPHMPKRGQSVPLEIRHYGSAPGTFQLYDDDGETFGYEQGKYRWREVAVGAADGSLAGTISQVEGDWDSFYGEVSWSFMQGKKEEE